MTTVDKLGICGIRSYDPQSHVVIKFFKPLTVILGQNGCGKTTIIEALKYCCTGEAPQLTERGRTWIHDPKHCGESIVKAQIKVAFKTRDNKPVIAINSMQLTRKKKKDEFKTIDGVVRTYDENTKQVRYNYIHLFVLTHLYVLIKSPFKIHYPLCILCIRILFVFFTCNILAQTIA